MTRAPLTITGDLKRDIPFLEARFGNDASEAAESASILAGIGDPAALAALVRMVEHPDQFMRRIAVEAIVRHREAKRAVTTLVSRLYDDSPYVVRTACAAVAKLGHLDAAPRIRELTRDDDASTRAAAVDALGALQEPGDREYLQRLHDQEGNPEVQRAAARALERSHTATTWRAAFDEWSSSADPLRRLEACNLAMRYAEPSDTATIEPLTRDPNAAVRASAWRISWRLRGANGWPATPLPPGRDRIKVASRPEKNGGWTDVQYELSDDPELNDRVSEILNEACHVFHYHQDGNWKNGAKETYASLLVKEFEANAWLVRILLGLDDRVISSIVHRSVEMTKEARRAPDLAP